MAEPAKTEATCEDLKAVRNPPLSWRAVCPPSIGLHARAVKVNPTLTAPIDTVANLTLDGGAEPRHDNWGTIAL